MKYQYLRRKLQYLLVASVGVAAGNAGIVPVSAEVQIAAQNQIISDDGAIFTHPDQKFSVFVPSDAEVLESTGTIDLAMRSRVGWMINIQSSPANPTFNLKQMAGRFEAKYVGPGKTWKEKLSGEVLTENSYSGVYDGSGARIQVVIERTPEWDFVLTFTAPSGSFDVLSEVFLRTLASFHPIVKSTPTTSDGTEDTGSGGAEAIPTGQLNRYHSTTLGYAISYPAQWIVSKPDEFTTVFSGVSGSESGYAGVSIRNVAAPGFATPRGRAEGLLQQLKTQMAYTDGDIRHERTVAITIGRGSQKAQGLQLVSTFRRGEVDYRQWSIAAPRPDGNIVHMWTYVAPLEQFYKYQGIAEKMAGSMEFIPVLSP